MPIYSHSQLSTYEQCPLRYKFRYIDKIHKPEEKGVEAFTGTLVHEALEKLYDDLKYEKLNSFEDLLAFYRDSWQRNWNPGIKMVREGLSEENYREYGARCISNYYRRHHPFRASQTLETEMHLVFPLGQQEEYKFQGYIDRLARRPDGTYEIHDYKTGGRLPSQAEADHDRQLALYQCGLELRWPGVDRVDLIWHYAGLDATLVSRRTPEEIRNLISDTIELIRRIEAATEFPPVKSRLCDWCEYRPECPLWNHVAAVEAMPPLAMAEDEGVRLANEFAAAKSELDRLSRSIEDLRQRILIFARQVNTRVVQGNGVRVSVAQHERLDLPPRGDAARDEAEAFIRSIGKWDEVSDLSGGKLSAALESAAWPESWRDRLRGLLRKRQSATLRLTRMDESDSGARANPDDEPESA
ncbi:MAG: PD-(D/E)XK nuclease family protein [Acidobacteriota bacterium]|nr:PD-(D/E)XK nuclease family protein [Acidobacteriota bacterium]